MTVGMLFICGAGGKHVSDQNENRTTRVGQIIDCVCHNGHAAGKHACGNLYKKQQNIADNAYNTCSSPGVQPGLCGVLMHR